jgi:ABC-type multidrug transport system fused ATPase/permease subunit
VESPFYMKLEDLCFSFGEKEVFHKISGEIKSNQKTAIVGENGTGKSTLVRILCGLYENYKGKFTINGQELKSIQSDYWRKQIAYVEQNPYLFEGTVRENIHLGNPNATEHEVDHVLEVLQITNLAQRLCGNEQENLSGGERQKVAIARALLKNASVLVLDEPGNHLDAEALVWLNDFIRSYEGTLIYISHDKESVGNNDYVIAL